ncbi:MAG: hypothetical protein KBB91_02915 [Candidatus Pacebacteria bacterium]|nr:hypothetical protein [Candidatus Paceibacterota bacterium]
MKKGEYNFTYSQQYAGGRRRNREEDITLRKYISETIESIIDCWQQIVTSIVFIGSYFLIPFEECSVIWIALFCVYSAVVWPKDFKIFLVILTLVIGGLLSYLLYIIF